ncbi:MAG TPA: trehalase family glycosidase [Kiritimatiellia bacterium]|mgnify:CR=1 FL=1|nr:trehalase family glycosidase [Kiritimatiellia bacterium]
MRMHIARMAMVGLMVQTSLASDWKARVPRPVLDSDPGLVELYWKAWEMAHESIREKPGLPQTPYLWPGAWDHSIWIWDTCFMAMFARYAPDVVPAIQSMKNFYVPLHDGWKGLYPLNIQHPDNPPLFAWVEYDFFKLTGDRAHVNDLLGRTRYLQRHFDWIENLKPGWRFESDTEKKVSAPVRLKKTRHGYLWNRYPSGMDNTTRGRGADNEILWIDAIAQQGLSALYIARLAEAVGMQEEAASWRDRYEQIKKTVNTLYWDEEDGFYYDIDSFTLKPVKVMTPASYWPMFAEMCSPEQARRMLKHALDEKVFGGDRPWPTLARTDPDYAEALPDGHYWRGGVWPPTTYMATKALQKYGFHDEANELAHRSLQHALRTYRAVEPATLWEALSPSRDYPASKPAKTNKRTGKPLPDARVRLYVGWSSLPPISLLIENVLGFHTIDAQRNVVEWRLHRSGRHGIENLRFGQTTASILTDGAGNVRVGSTAPFTLIINGVSHDIPAGQTALRTGG